MTDNEKIFIDEYEYSLKWAKEKYPQDYSWPVSELPRITERMKNAILARTFSHDGKAMKKTCVTLGIKHGRKSILNFLNGSTK
jgi:hypothetical protein